jgi:hypothetical protein
MEKKQVSFRIAKLSNGRVLNQINHDMRIGWQPKYIKHDKSSLNSLLYGSKMNKDSYYDLKKEQNSRSKRKIQKNTERFFSGIMTFDSAMAKDYENNEELFEKCSKDYLRALEGLGLQINYAELHLDEDNPHIHLMFDNISKVDGKSIRRTVNPEMLKECQTLMGKSFEPMGYCRGEFDSKRKHLNVKLLHELNEVKEKLKEQAESYKSELNIFDKILENEILTDDEVKVLKTVAPSLFQFIDKSDKKSRKDLNDSLEATIRKQQKNKTKNTR